MGRDIDIRVTVSTAEMAAIDTAATALGVSRAALLREAGLREARRIAVGLPGAAPDLPHLRFPEVEAERATEARIDAELARLPRMSDPAIAEALDLTVDTVRRHRESRGIPGVAPQGGRPLVEGGWEAAIRSAHASGLTAEGIAEATGYSVGTVRTRLSRLGLRAAPSGATRGRPRADADRRG